jgi:hypothetical protein
MTSVPRPRCGNDPRAQLTDGDRQAIADFRAYLTRRAQEKTMPEADRNTGPGWYEVISPRATTCIAYVHEDGSLYLPEGDTLTHEEFAFAAARGNAHKLVRVDETQPAQSQPTRKQLLTLATPCAVCTHPYNWHQAGVCQAGDEENRCGCIAFAQAQQDGAQS